MHGYKQELRLVDQVAADAIRGSVGPLDAARLRRAKVAYTARRMAPERVETLITGQVHPRAGDLLLARVDTLRQHSRLELANGRRAHLYPGDEIVVCYANRYAPDQFHSVVPAGLEPCHLVAAGGIASRAVSRNAGIKPATEIRPIGLLGDRYGRVLSLSDFALAAARPRGPRPRVTAVVGTSMNAGKTTTAAYLIRGLAQAGMRVGAAKITGTGAGGDVWRMTDAGADEVLDFTDIGLGSTYCVAAAEIEQALVDLTDHLHAAGVEAVVIEIADGLYQAETARLLSSSVFAKRVDSVVFAAADAMSAVAGVGWLQERNLPVRVVTGTVSLSPLGSQEAEQHLTVPVVAAEALSEPRFAVAVQPRSSAASSTCRTA